MSTFGTRRRRVLTWSVITSISLTFLSCEPSRTENTISGYTQGTTYQIKLIDGNGSVTKQQIDSILHDFDLSLSTYIENSVISRINNARDSITLIAPAGYFKRCYLLAAQIHAKTNGAFDPSVYPLVEGWGFMKNVETPLDKKKVDSIMQYVDFTKGRFHSIRFSGDTVFFKKMHPGFKLDFNAIAQGLSVDIISEYLMRNAYTDYYIEIGGEVYVSGKNKENKPWSIGIDTPEDNATEREIENVVYVSGKAIATSGNYRKYYIKDGVKYAHTLNPKTGYPVNHSLLSATVIAYDCATADAYATAFMVMGKDSTLNFLNSDEEFIEVYLLYDQGNGKIGRVHSSGFKKYLNK